MRGTFHRELRVQPRCRGSPYCPLKAPPNTYEDPGCQETNLPYERISPIFFRYASGQASSVSGNVFRLHFRLLVRERDCTKHLLRVDRHRDGGYRACEYSALCPRNLSVPSYRPTQTWGCTSVCASEAQVRGRGSTRSPSGTFAIWTGARAGVQSNAQGQGKVPMCS
jgi:hypothetical protein